MTTESKVMLIAAGLCLTPPVLYGVEAISYISNHLGQVNQGIEKIEHKPAGQEIKKVVLQLGKQQVELNCEVPSKNGEKIICSFPGLEAKPGVTK